MRLAILCSGQGPQAPGMFDLVAEAPEAQPIFAMAARHLAGRDPRDLATPGSNADMHGNATAQILCCTQALAAWAVLAPKAPAPTVVAGYSVGEMAAWGIAGAIEPAAVLALTARRAALMDAAVTEPAGLLAVGGVPAAGLDRICASAGVHLAIRIAADRAVLGGRRPALDEAGAAAREAGARRITPLPVAVPSHTPLLRQAADRFGADLRALTDVKAPSVRLISGIDGSAVYAVADGLAKLGRQVAETVDWAACLDACRAAGATHALELGPGDALARMAGEVLDPRACRSVAEFRTLHGVAQWMERA